MVLYSSDHGSAGGGALRAGGGARGSTASALQSWSLADLHDSLGRQDHLSLVQVHSEGHGPAHAD